MYGSGAGWWAGPGVKQSCLRGSSADAAQHFAVGRHGLAQVLHHSVLHNIVTSEIELRKVVFELAADAVQHLAVAGHGLDQVLHHSVLHNIVTSEN